MKLDIADAAQEKQPRAPNLNLTRSITVPSLLAVHSRKDLSGTLGVPLPFPYRFSPVLPPLFDQRDESPSRGMKARSGYVAKNPRFIRQPSALWPSDR